jgi:hypothetical protein
LWEILLFLVLVRKERNATSPDISQQKHNYNKS